MKFEFYDPDKDKTPAKKRSSGEKGTFTLDWVRELGWNNNPFDLTNQEIADMEEERQVVNLFFIKAKPFGSITGDTGTGKTVLLRWLHEMLSEFKEIDNHFVSAKLIPNEAEFRKVLAAPYKFFGKNKDISTSELTELIKNKASGRYALLIDDADELSKGSMEDLKALVNIGASIIVTHDGKLKETPAKDELKLKIKPRSLEDYEKILKHRIEDAGGNRIQPFTVSVVKKLGKHAKNTREFLAAAQEYAINAALKLITHEDINLEDESVSDEIAKETTSKNKGKKGKKQYDDLIESLTSELE